MRRFLECLVVPSFIGLKGQKGKYELFPIFGGLFITGVIYTSIVVWPRSSWADFLGELSEEEARQIAFENIQRIVPLSPCSLGKISQNLESRLEKGSQVQGLQEIEVRDVSVLKQYGASKMTCFYGRNGALKMLEWESVGETRQQPWVNNRRYLYGKTAGDLGLQDGQLLFVTLKVSESKSYVFESSGALYATWQNGQCIRASGDACPR